MCVCGIYIQYEMQTINLVEQHKAVNPFILNIYTYKTFSNDGDHHLSYAPKKQREIMHLTASVLNDHTNQFVPSEKSITICPIRKIYDVI